MFDARLVADRLERELRGLATPERAAKEKRYLRSDLEFVGATVGDIRRSVRTALKENDSWDHSRLIALVEELWRKPIHERRMAAVVLLASCERLLNHEDLDLIERMIRESRTWALVDGLAAKVTGALARRDERTGPTLDRWSRDGDFWVRRSALLALMPTLEDGGDFERFERYADGMLEDGEFFIRKAIGWVLREVSKSRPEEVFGWLAPRTGRVSGVTIREAVKYLSPEQRETLMAAYAQRRPAGFGSALGTRASPQGDT